MTGGAAITVCVCTHDRPDYLAGCLDGLAAQDASRERFEIVVVDSACAPDAAVQVAGLAARHGARVVRLDRRGISAARNAGAAAAAAPWIAYIDDDAVPMPDWVSRLLDAIAVPAPPVLLGGRILPLWETPLPAWWPRSLRGVLSIIEHDGPGEFRSPALPKGLEPYAANMAVCLAAMRAAGGFRDEVGRYGGVLLSDEEVQLAWRLQDLGGSVRFDPSITVQHRIQAGRLVPDWLLRRLYWQGASTVVTRRLTRQADRVWRELPRRLLVLLLYAPAAVLPRGSTRLIALRWRFAYARGFVRAALGWHPAETARR